MSVVSNDLWPKDQVDPLADPAPVAETPAPEPAPEPEPAQAAEPEPALDQAKTATETPELESVPAPGSAEEEDWKRRHDILRDTQRRTAEERNDAFRQRDEALALARQVYEDTQRRAKEPTGPTPLPDAVRSKAAELGITDDQLAFMQQLADERAQQATGQLQTQYQADQESQRQTQYAQQVASQRMTVVNTFRQLHPDAIPMEEDIFEVLREVGMVDGSNQFVQPELRMDHLEAALEAAKDPGLRAELRANPQWYDTDEGMAYARRQASLAKLLATATPVTSTSSVADSEAAVAAAETLPASGGPPPGSGGPPGDEFDKVLEYDRNHKKDIFH